MRNHWYSVYEHNVWTWQLSSDIRLVIRKREPGELKVETGYIVFRSSNVDLPLWTSRTSSPFTSKCGLHFPLSFHFLLFQKNHSSFFWRLPYPPVSSRTHLTNYHLLQNLCFFLLHWFFPWTYEYEEDNDFGSCYVLGALWFICLNPQTSLMVSFLFIDAETEALGSSVIFPSSHSCQVVKLEVNSRSICL